MSATTSSRSGIPPKVVVRRQWNDYRTANYSLDALTAVRWDFVSGGVKARTPQPFIHAVVLCDAMLEGELAHSGSHGPCPHKIKVCVVKKDNDPEVFAELIARAGPKPLRSCG
jgi:hypothetical protein